MILDVRVQNLTASRSRLAGGLLVLAAVQYLALEAVAAAAWNHPSYSYAANFISDLGNPVSGDVFNDRIIDSPLHAAMNTAFVAQGVLYIAAALLLLRPVQERLGRTLLVLAVLHGTGVIVVGFFPESGLLGVHLLGAMFTIVAGNVIAIVIGVTGARVAAAGWYRRVSVALGVVGIAGVVLLQADRHLAEVAPGVPERAAVYTIIVWEVITGIALLIRALRPSDHPSVREELAA
jgi:hypothetical membrane protein